MIKITDKLTGEALYTASHKSGLEIFIMPRKGYKKNYAMFATKYGSIDSEFIVPGHTQPTKVPDGVAHYLEHKMFDMPDGENIFERFSKYGADANAFTSFNMTAYLFSSTANFKENLKTLLEYVQTPYFTEETIQKEQGIIAQEIKMYEDNPGWAVFFGFLGCLYHNNPVKKEIAGTVESIAEIDSELLYNCYNTFYNLSNMKLFVTGDFDPDDIYSVIDANIKDTKPFTDEIKRIYPEEPSTLASSYYEKHLSVSQPQFMMGYKDTVVGGNGKELLKRYMLTDILLSMLINDSTPFYTMLMEQGLINDTFGGDYTISRSYGYTSIEGESEDPEGVRDAILAEVRRLRKEGLDRDAFERLKKAAWGDYIRAYDNISGFASTFMMLSMLDINYMTDYFEVYDSLTFEDAQKRFDEHFSEDHFAMSVIRPTE